MLKLHVYICSVFLKKKKVYKLKRHHDIDFNLYRHRNFEPLYVNILGGTVSHTATIIDYSSLPYIQTVIDKCIAIYRRMFYNKVIQKHLLEHHCIPHIKKHKFGLGLLGEQGRGNSHRLIAHLEKHRAQVFTNKLDRLNHILTVHLLQIAPSLQA